MHAVYPNGGRMKANCGGTNHWTFKDNSKGTTTMMKVEMSHATSMWAIM